MEKKKNSNKVLLQVPFLFLRNSAKQSQSQLQYVQVQRWISAVLPHSQRRCNNHTFCLRCVFVNKQHIKNPLKILSSGQVPSSPLFFFFFPAELFNRMTKQKVCKAWQRDFTPTVLSRLGSLIILHPFIGSGWKGLLEDVWFPAVVQAGSPSLGRHQDSFEISPRMEISQLLWSP